MDLFLALICALRSGYAAVADLPGLPAWGRLPATLRGPLGEAVAAGATLREVSPLIGRARVEHLGPPAPDDTGERTREIVALLLGLLALAHREGRLGPAELLTRAWRVADSYVCDLDSWPFVRLGRALAAGEPDGGRVAALFAEYIGPAEAAVERWGLRPPHSRARTPPAGG